MAPQKRTSGQPQPASVNNTRVLLTDKDIEPQARAFNRFPRAGRSKPSHRTKGLFAFSGAMIALQSKD
jgi:hypothetical protein